MQNRDICAISNSLNSITRADKEKLCQCCLGMPLSSVNGFDVYRDVAITFHTHLLSPFRFYANMSCRGPHSLLIDSKVFFPLEQLHHLITHDIWSDADSQRQWTKAFPTKPYQLWDTDRFTTAAPLQLQDVDIG